ncbi:glyoxylase-like metal-dependent hydrolase (beta-lactamase superfamily II) [Geodermatophilus bullaregiensis]|uniref:MBL fold metallo-hydrolase n=1 Tax=Geodermatophilus bullaregiensis TaxID=1564160 RepID=UPI0019563E08|nr:MBL fold metallo-hydrolase [Geodermatophilus bullaregiensis]MBM7805053.1 glyoxylase-like metal-dependent hydrolase (beta-lactamase superfamily II) [Geodermatophilus bullaregiensis]
MTTLLESVAWIHGAADCSDTSDPLIQVHRLDRDTFVLRLSKCYSFEANFLFLLLGRDRALLLDTGARPDAGARDRTLPLRRTVDELLTRWSAERGVPEPDLVVAHTHAHGDHVSGDDQFTGRPRTSVVAPTLPAVTGFFGLTDWPDGEASLDLGGRRVTVLPIPGHEPTHIAVHDSGTRALFTGDTLYPGLLTVRDWPAFRRSAARLADLVRREEVSVVLGAHVEMTRTPGELYPLGTTHQPDEHPLPLTPASVLELHEACEAMAGAPHLDVHDDFVIRPPLPDEPASGTAGGPAQPGT